MTYGLNGHELFSERTFPTQHDVLTYDNISRKARVQCFQYIYYMFENEEVDLNLDMVEGSFNEEEFYEIIMNHLKRRRGLLSYSELFSSNMLMNRGEIEQIRYQYNLGNHSFEFFSLFIYSNDNEYLLILDLIELLAKMVEVTCTTDSFKIFEDQINMIFRSNAIGYELINGTVIHKGNEVVHSEVVRPALYAISQQEYAGANQELLQAFSDFKESQFKNAIVNANKSFESTLKIIIEKQGWECVKFLPYAQRKAGQPLRTVELQRAVASDLIETLNQNIEIESFHKSALTGLANSLQSLASLRNTVGHGQGAVVSEVDIRRCEFAIHTAAANILFLIRTYG